MTNKELREKLERLPDDLIMMIPDVDYPYYVPISNVARGLNEADGCIFLEKYEDDN